jgi:predicted RNA binding protein YcfA (HicA-like mRNA interferase family)
LAKLRVLSGHEVCAILAGQGFAHIRQRGSHIAMQRSDGSGTTTVVVPDHSEIANGTLGSIIRQCGLKRELFEV